MILIANRMELRNVTRPKSCFHYDSLFRFLNHPANRVSFGMVCDLDTDFLLLATGQNVKYGHFWSIFQSAQLT